MGYFIARPKRLPQLMLAFLFAGFFSVISVDDFPSQRVNEADAADSWNQEFNAICSGTEDSMALSPDELRILIRRCDALRPRIEHLGDTERKVYLKRLQMCRNLYQFVFDAKAAETSPSAKP